MQEALDKANLTERDLSAVAVTIGPGLSLCLRGNSNHIAMQLSFYCLCPIVDCLRIRMRQTEYVQYAHLLIKCNKILTNWQGSNLIVYSYLSLDVVSSRGTLWLDGIFVHPLFVNKIALKFLPSFYIEWNCFFILVRVLFEFTFVGVHKSIFSMNWNAVGVQKARNIASHFNLPVVGVHHMEAHALVAR